jgi:hypothetical protein
MASLARVDSVNSATLSGHDILVMAVLVSFPVIGFDQFLRAVPSKVSEQAAGQIQNWLTGSLLAVPLFAVGIWAGDRIARRAGLGTARPSDAVKRAMVVTLLAALALTPVWFRIDRSDNPVAAQPLIAPHAQDSGDVYWVPGWVVVTLVCACLAPAAIWAGWSLARCLRARLPRGAAPVTCAALLVPLAAVPAAAWLLHQAAGHAYSSRVYYATSTPFAAPVRSGALAAATRGARSHPSPAVTAAPRPQAQVNSAPYAFADQAAHALQDGLAGQVAGLPVAAIVLLRAPRRPDNRYQHQSADAHKTPQGGSND